MITIKKLELYREFQKNIMNVAESEALMCGFNEYTVSVRNHSTEVTIYLHGYAAVLIFYISGRVVVKYIVTKKDHEETVVIDKTDWDYAFGRCTVADLVSRYVYKVFDVALEMRQRRRLECKERHKESKNAEDDVYPDDEKFDPEAVVTIGNQPHQRFTSAEDKLEIKDYEESYLADYDSEF